MRGDAVGSSAQLRAIALGAAVLLSAVVAGQERPDPPRGTTGAAAPQATSQTTSQSGASTADRRRTADQRGASRLTEDAVEAGLAWLAAHQEPRGHWDRVNFIKRCPPGDSCGGMALGRTDASLDAGLTGLVVLAFVGAGYTDREGPYQECVRGGVSALLAMQQPDGGFSDDAMAGYNDSLATFALAELYAQTRDPALRPAIERGAARLVRSQQALGGWDYLPRPDTARNDTSITAWAVQALLACSAAGVEVPPASLARAALHLARATEADGRVWYSDTGTGFELDAKTLRPVYRYGSAMTAAGFLCEQLLGWRADGPTLHAQQALLFADPPSVARLKSGERTQLHSYYYWYYATVGLFLRGGDAWPVWNAQLRDALLPLQVRQGAAGRKSHAFGSWPPFGANWGKWGRVGGRVYTTAINVLTLETYYRHQPVYLGGEPLLTAAHWRSFVQQADERERVWCAALLGHLRLEIGEPILLELLSDVAPTVARQAADSLLSLDSPLGQDVLRRAASAAAGAEKALLERKVARAAALAQLPPAQGRIRVFDADSRLATAELDRAYAGMRLALVRDGRPQAALRVAQRFSGKQVVVVELVEPIGFSPQPDDALVSD